MDLHSQPQMLDRYSFLWSEARLVIAAIALFLGGVPPVYYLLRAPALFGLISSLLTLAWIISGAASGYLLYRWYTARQTLFGAKVQRDAIAFFISTVSGLNLGLAGLLRKNIGMSISSSKFIFVVVAVLYLGVAGYLYKRWQESGQKIF